MRVSFDLDDTLICYQEGVPQEPPLPWYVRPFAASEPLRRGALSLMADLQRRGVELWIYTTSYRDPWSVWWWLLCHGVRVRRVINQDVHDAHLRRGQRDYPPSKNPRAFGIDLHVDDSDGVRMEGRQHGFQVVVVSPDDQAWADKVRRAVGV
jgi:FMN phosphatase YigB (HAD superfamily)